MITFKTKNHIDNLVLLDNNTIININNVCEIYEVPSDRYYLCYNVSGNSVRQITKRDYEKLRKYSIQ